MSRKKHGIRAIIAVLFILIPLITYGGGKQEEPVKASGAAGTASKPVNLTYVHGSAGGGTWAILAEGIAESVRRTSPGSVVTTVPGSSKGNIVRLAKNEADLGYTFLDNLIDATQGRDGFEKTDIKVIGSTHSTIAQWIALSSLGIESIREIKEKKPRIRLSVHQRGSGNEQYNRRLLEEYGISYADIESWGGKIVYAGEPDTVQLIADGQLDAFGGGGAPPNAAFIDLARKRKITSLKMDKDVIASMGKKYGYTPAVIRGNTYDFIPEDYQTFAATVVVAVRGDMPDDVAYLLAKAMHQNKDYLGTVHSSAKVHMVDNPKGIIEGIPEIAPVHPGALKYYREVGLVK